MAAFWDFSVRYHALLLSFLYVISRAEHGSNVIFRAQNDKTTENYVSWG